MKTRTQDTDQGARAARLVAPAAAGFSRARSRNVCDGVVRLSGQDPGAGVVRVSLIGAGHRFAPGHRIRLQVAGGAHPRFARNPGTGQAEAPARDLVPTQYRIDLAASALLLPVTG